MLANKNGLIIGIANEYSIGYATAKEAIAQGANICLTYQGDLFKKRVLPIAEDLGCTNVFELDATSEESINAAAEEVRKNFGRLDFVLHSIAYSDKNELKGRYLDTTYSNFVNTMNVSCYSLLSIIRGFEYILNDNASVVTMTYYGAQKTITNYNVMGVAKAALECSVKYLALDLGINGTRINAISAGPIKTLAASGIGEFRKMLDVHKNSAPLRRNTNQHDVAKSAVYLFSDMSCGVTGEIHYVDCGYNTVGLTFSQEI